MQVLRLPSVSSKEQHRPKATLDLVLPGIPGMRDGGPVAGGHRPAGDCFGLTLRLLGRSDCRHFIH